MPTIKGSSFAKIGRAVVFDVETTGLESSTHRIVSIAALKVDFNSFLEGGGGDVATYESLVNPERKIPAAASSINGIFDFDVQSRPNFGAHSDELLDFFEDLPLVAHNCEFDAGFLNQEFLRSGKASAITAPFFCTMKRACHHMTKAGHYRSRVSLVDACNFFKVPFSRGKTHHALDDALAALKLAATFVSIDRT